LAFCGTPNLIFLVLIRIAISHPPTPARRHPFRRSGRSVSLERWMRTMLLLG
jgi:hypothetical protein